MNKKMKQQMKELKLEAKNRKKLKKKMTPKERFEFQENFIMEQQKLKNKFVSQNESKEGLEKLGIRTSYGRYSCDNCKFMRTGDYCAFYEKKVSKTNWCNNHEKMSVVIYYGGAVSPR